MKDSNPQTINKLIVIGILLIAIGIVAEVALIKGDHKELVTILSNIVSGLIGFMGSSVAHAFSTSKEPDQDLVKQIAELKAQIALLSPKPV